MPRPKSFKVEELARALEASGGIFAHAIRAMADAGRPISRKSLYSYVQRHPELQEVVADAQAELVDVAQGWLRKFVEEGNPRAVFYTLDRLGRDHGFGPTKEPV